MARAWYAYKGLPLDPELPGSYLYIPAQPACRTGFTLCAVYAVYAGTHPATISTNLKQYIALGLTSGVPAPPGNTGKYVYMKAP